MPTRERIYYLLNAYTSKTATAAEEAELMDWIMEAQEDDALKNYMLEVWGSYQPGEHRNKVDWDGMFNTIMQEEKVIPITRVPKRILWMWVAAAVAILLVISIGGYFYFNHQPSKEIASSGTPATGIHDIAAPSGNKAILTLADGRVIELDSAGQGALALQGAVHIEKTADGQIIYKGDATEIKMNTLSVPRGSMPVQLVLADGSKVWLNASSSITYPTAFAGNDRKVSMTGEAYFEIAHDASKPFFVSKGDVNVRVLGTHFNVNAYNNEAELKVTLLQGSVNVSIGQKSAILKPGEQAEVGGDGDLQTTSNVNIEEVMAWKNGKFYFEKATIHDVMNQISRWYDVDVEYKGNISEHFGGTISKNVDASKVFEMLEFTGGVEFRVEGRKVIVMPKN